MFRVRATALACAALTVAGLASPVASAAPVAARPAPVIVIDPGHSRTIHAVDGRTKLDVSDYENEPEMRDMYAVAGLVATSLRRAGYRVVLTKSSLRQKRSLAQRAAIANRAHAALALSIHDQAGHSGGVGFKAGNNTVYYQSVGGYRTNTRGHKVVFRDKALARTSKRYGRIFAAQRHRVQHTKVKAQGSVGYNLGSRGLPAGTMWMVQLLSKVPWIYNEAGGNSKGRVGLNAHDRRVYANALVASVERCVPVR